MGMSRQKVSPATRKEIVTRVAAGEKQKDLAAEYNVPPAYISKIWNADKARTSDDSIQLATRFRKKPASHLRARYQDIGRMIDELLSQRATAKQRSKDLQLEIYRATERLSTTQHKNAIESQILLYKAELTKLKTHQREDTAIRQYHAEQYQIVSELLHHGESL